jgi:hypothetical protein
VEAKNAERSALIVRRSTDTDVAGQHITRIETRDTPADTARANWYCKGIVVSSLRRKGALIVRARSDSCKVGRFSATCGGRPNRHVEDIIDRRRHNNPTLTLTMTSGPHPVSTLTGTVTGNTMVAHLQGSGFKRKCRHAQPMTGLVRACVQ